MIEFADLELHGIYIHQVGNILREEHLKISKEEVSFSDDDTQSYLLEYLLSPFANNEVYNFAHPSELELNEIYSFVKRLFVAPGQLYEISIEIAKHLYEHSNHPKINGGDLYVCFFNNCTFDGITCDAVGFFKSEVKDVFLQFDSIDGQVNIKHENGININKLDKGCLIFNLEEEKGYKVCVVDSKSKDTQYWKNDFLNVKPASDDYHYTNDFLSITKEFVTKQLSDKFEINKTDQIDLLNRSVDYFKTNDKFEKEEFENSVFQNQELIESFRNFDHSYRDENEIQRSDSFDISPQAVKKQVRAFKSVLKLDKNFHIYIHGDKDLIKQGVEVDGRKYYKIYYKDEK